MKPDPRESLADDPGFVNSLDSLDDGLPDVANNGRGRGVQAPVPARLSPLPALAVLSPDEARTCEAFFGLRERPFGPSADPRFFYHSTSHDQVAQQLLTAVRGREGIVILTGDAGTGKTTVCRAVVEQLDRRTLTSLVLNPRRSSGDLLRAVLADFGVISQHGLASQDGFASQDGLAGGASVRPGRRELSEALRQFLTSLTALQAFAVVVIDSGHNLAVEVLQHLRMLSDIASQDRLLQVVLVGESGLLEQLGRPELQQLAGRITLRCTLGPLLEDEMGDYLLHRLGVAGWSGPSPFDTGAETRLYQLSAGNPREINRLCDRALTLGCDAGLMVVDRSLVDRAAEDPPRAPTPAVAFPPDTVPHVESVRSRFRSRLLGWLS